WFSFTAVSAFDARDEKRAARPLGRRWGFSLGWSRKGGRIEPAGMEWVALTHANERKQGPAQSSMGLEAGEGVPGARGLEAAHLPEPRRNRPLVQSNQRHEHVADHHRRGPLGLPV